MDITGTLEKCRSQLTATEKEELKTELSAYLNQLLLNDFPALVQILYRVDVPEEKLKCLLRENPETDAGDLLAELIVQRQERKAVIRNAPLTNETTDEESW